MDPGIVAQAGHVSGQAPPQPFDVVVRGYDRHQVDEHIRQLETQARRLRERERPSYARPGSQIEQLLRLAEEQVTKIVQESRSAADELQAEAEADAAELRAAAEGSAGPLASGVEAALVAEELGRGLVDVPFVGPTLAADLRRPAGAPPAASPAPVLVRADAPAARRAPAAARGAPDIRPRAPSWCRRPTARRRSARP